MKCTACNNGKVFSPMGIYENGKFISHEPLQIDCKVCGGTGQINDSQKERMDNSRNAYCVCGNPSGKVTPYRYKSGARGYYCNDCLKIIEIVGSR